MYLSLGVARASYFDKSLKQMLSGLLNNSQCGRGRPRIPKEIKSFGYYMTNIMLSHHA